MDHFMNLRIMQSITEVMKQLAAIEMILLDKKVVTEEEFKQYQKVGEKVVNDSLGKNNPAIALSEIDGMLGKLGLKI